MTYDLVIIGGGPAGAAAAVYAARKQLKTALVTESFGGQSVVSEDIQNWIGTPHISGVDLASALESHVREYEGQFLEVLEGIRGEKVSGTKGDFTTVLSDGKELTSRSVLIASGSKRRTLTVEGAAEFENKGVTYCASCDGPLFSGQDVVVVGGGNAGFETAAQLLAYCKSVTLLNRSAEVKADEITVAKTLAHPNFTLLKETEIEKIYGSAFVEGVVIKNKQGETTDMKVAAVFVEVGQLPNSDLVAQTVERTPGGQVIIDPKTQKTSVEGIWAAGDVTDVLYHQNNIAAGDAVRALEDIYQWLHRN